MKLNCRLLVTTCWLVISLQLYSQDSIVLNNKVGLQYAGKVSTKADELNKKLDKKSQQALQQLQKQEAKMKRKLMKIDSLAANNVFADADKKYKDLAQRLKGSKTGQYIPKLDTLITSMKFFEENPQLLSQAKEVKEKVKDALGKVNGLKDQFNKAEDIKEFLKERKQYLKQELSKFGFAKELKKINKEAYYYTQQVNEYKEILKDSKKTERKAIELLSKTKLFKDFMRKNSQLASLFRLPNEDDLSPFGGVGGGLAGLQTRAQVNNLIQQQIAAGGPGAQQQFSQNLQAAQSQLNELKNKINQFGGGSSDAAMPEFKPNNQKTKSFLKRLEYGTNIQTQKATYFFPVTSDIGLSVGYKLTDKSIIGIGASYKMGWGRGWNDMRISHQGVGFRTYADIKLKGSFWLSGGYEQNYKPDLQNVSIPSSFGGSRMGALWQQSGLVGFSKMISLKTKFFKKTKALLLWDFLSYQQIPRGQAIIFRIGYTMK
ncbi:MAG TPA: hypothetical protein VF487_18270 [Chitinophagaceae bacterium]